MIVCALSVFSALVVFSFAQGTNVAKDEFSLLNSKYQLMAVEPFDNGDQEASSLSYLFTPDMLTANTFNAFSPEVELIVKLKNENDSSSFKGIFLLRLKTYADPVEIAEQYGSISLVSYAEPNFAVELSDDVKTNSFKAVGDVKLSDSDSDAGVVVAVVDSGVDTNHKDLKNRIVKGYDFISNSEVVSDDYGHGTHVAGIITSNSSAKIMPIKFTDGKKGKISNLVKAIKFAVDNDVDVINLSLGLKQKSSLLKDAIVYASEENIPVVAAAGNYNTSDKYYPAAYSDAIAVTALAKDGTKLRQSNFGTWVDYSVVAQDIYSTMPNDKYGFATGTSQAASKVSAKIAEILKNKRDATIEDILLELDEMATLKDGEKPSDILGLTL